MIEKRRQTLYRAWCEWCGIAVSTWYSDRRTVKGWELAHRELHEEQGRVGQSIRAIDYPERRTA